MGRIVAISGGNLLTTRPLNKYAIKLSKKQNPRVLFIGTASHDAQEYIHTFTNEYEKLGCEVKILCLCSECTDKEVDELLAWADIIYVGGGDTVFMMKVWKKRGLNEKLEKIYQKDTAVLTGISAGAICWFNCGHSDSGFFEKDDKSEFCWADGMLDLIHMAFCPHYNNEQRRSSFDGMLQDKNMVGLAMEDDTAFVSDNGKQYFIKSDVNANAFVLEYKNQMIKKTKVEFSVL